MLGSVRAACREVRGRCRGTQVVEEALGDADLPERLPARHRLPARAGAAVAPRRSTARSELNGAQVERNKAAFALGRARGAGAAAGHAAASAETLDALIARRVADLTAYQNARYARDYADFVAKVRAAEQAAVPGAERLARAVATQLYRLMAYKDEYEVARLHSLPDWQAQARRSDFTGTQRIELNLAPPILAKTDPLTGHPRKRPSAPGC